MIKPSAFLLLSLLLCSGLGAQNFRVEDVNDRFANRNPFRIAGGLSANTVVNTGNETLGRDPFTCYLNGNIDLNLYGLVHLPLSFRLTNSTASFLLPSTPNRLSISPSYKWISGHFGDVALSFSPYTLNGRLFTGAGVELKPQGWELKAMYGRMLRAVEYDDSRPEILPNYRRMAYGVKAGRSVEQCEISVNVLNVNDIHSSLAVSPDSLGITPMKNTAGSLAVMYKPTSRVNISTEYGLSLLTHDRRASNTNSTYQAFKAQVNVAGNNENSIGVGYERIDPNYQTLGAYYFVNDIENITVNAAQAFWQKKMNLSISIGYEHDDLNHTKASANSRMVGSALLTAKFSDRANASASYSNFQTYTNVRSNFDLINQENPLDLLDTLNFVQLSQSANLTVDILTKQSEARQDHFNLNFSYQDVADKQGNIYRPGSLAEMINADASYSVHFPLSGLMITGDLHINNSRLLNANTLTLGPGLSATSKVFKKTIHLSGSGSYNTGYLEGNKQNQVFLLRFNSSYIFMQKHHFSLAYSFRRQWSLDRPVRNSSLITAGYSYNF